MKWFGYPCVFHLITGLYCPGCGGTRALLALLKGQVVTSFFYHPLVPYMAVVFPAMVFYWLYCHKKTRVLSARVWKGVLYIGIAVIAVNFAVKNYYLICKGTDLLL